MKFDVCEVSGIGYEVKPAMLLWYMDADTVELDYISDALSDYISKDIFKVISYITETITEHQGIKMHDKEYNVAVVLNDNVRIDDVKSSLSLIKSAMIKLEIYNNDDSKTIGKLTREGLLYHDD